MIKLGLPVTSTTSSTRASFEEALLKDGFIESKMYVKNGKIFKREDNDYIYIITFPNGFTVRFFSEDNEFYDIKKKDFFDYKGNVWKLLSNK